ncbi:TrlF family AAA-like ATPase [Psychrobacter sp. Ps6]|uniref:TrlF family AAA-like ATPase n=1 Tax=Psychrobacter sp. Ps6 TaxID=2790960 RepID=UPI001EDFE1BD|nr:AAA family ATPase [Psychrobacter sp. Ps6]MCG3880114.1 AAA family ATPase [Psychrobacter sp. Ps6]
MSENYQGMRWLKCDLQVQTPEDSAHWADNDLRLGEPRRSKVGGMPCEKSIQEKARVFLTRCHELELDVIGITDHNFSQKSDPRDWFLTHLVEQNRGVAREVGRNPLVIFPGFEVDIGYHVLCLFPTAKKQTQLEDCNRYLTKLGLAESERFSSGTPNLLRKDGQNVSLKTLISLVQSEMGGIVIAAHSDQASGMLEQAIYREDFKHPELYCVEVTKNPPAQKYLDILEGRNTDWKRDGFYPAYIMSSDAKSLKTESCGKPKPNSLGYRHTWIKMSKPSIESLRQAFLDPTSRIKLPEDVTTDKNPSVLSNYPYIKSIKIEGAEFLDNQEIHFSPNKNSLIGGRGSGKSTVLEYLRLSLGKENKEQGSKAERVKKTTQNPDFKATVEYRQKHGVDYTLELTSAGTSVISHNAQDQAILLEGLPAQFFSQQQLNKITEADENGQLKSTELLLELVDGFVADELKELKEKEEILLGQIKHKQSLKILHDDNSEKITKLKQEIEGLAQQWQARQDVRADAETHSLLKKEKAYVDSLVGLVNNDIDQLKIKALEFDVSFSGFVHDDTPNTAWFKSVDQKVKNANQVLKDNILRLVEQHRSELDSFFVGSEQWASIQGQLDEADGTFQKACASKGIQPEDIKELTSLSAQKSQKEREVSQLERKNKEYGNDIQELDVLKQDLETIWGQQLDLRKQAADKANKLAVYEGSNKSFVTVELIYQGDKQYFLQAWEDFGPKDKRATLAKDWCDLIKECLERATSNLNSSIWTALYQELESDEELTEVKSYIDSNSSKWNKLITRRVPDSIDITLYRSDGSEAGKISANTLSDGQRNTAVLALLLAQDGGPLIIDQPEDELDSNFVFNELIPMIRRMKMKRQLIFATHNANLPVNGDADLLYAFEAKDGRGVCKAQGGLDCQDVTEAVLDIMEGSEKAFTSRREKYGF